jgi:6-phosphofructokinase
MKKIDTDLKKIVLAKIENCDDDWLLSIGGSGTFDKDALLKEVENETDIGLKVVAIQREYMEDMASGKFYQLLNSI